MADQLSPDEKLNLITRNLQVGPLTCLHVSTPVTIVLNVLMGFYFYFVFQIVLV